MRTPRLPVVEWTDAPADLNGLGPRRRKTKSGFCVCAITFQTQSTSESFFAYYLLFLEDRIFRLHLCPKLKDML